MPYPLELRFTKSWNYGLTFVPFFSIRGIDLDRQTGLVQNFVWLCLKFVQILFFLIKNIWKVRHSLQTRNTQIDIQIIPLFFFNITFILQMSYLIIFHGQHISH